MKLSIIVPIYNVEQYLRKCVYSLVHQDFSDYEIVLIDDGSTDESGKICDELSELISDERFVIRVLHQKNGGLSAARNAGLKVAKGEYVCFVDSDDYWEENVLGALMAQVEQDKLDVLRFDYRNVNEQYEVSDPNKYPHPIDLQTDVVTGEQYLNERMFYTCYAWQFIINREIAGSFTEGIHFEDVEWFPRMMLRAKKVNSTPIILYNYLMRQGSITQVQGDKSKIKKNLEDNYYVLNTLVKLILQHPHCIWLQRMSSMLVSGMLVTISTNFYQERKEYIKRLRSLNVFPLHIADQGKTYKRRAKIINLIGPVLYCSLMRMRK